MEVHVTGAIRLNSTYILGVVHSTHCVTGFPPSLKFSYETLNYYSKFYTLHTKQHPLKIPAGFMGAVLATPPFKNFWIRPCFYWLSAINRQFSLTEYACWSVSSLGEDMMR